RRGLRLLWLWLWRRRRRWRRRLLDHGWAASKKPARVVSGDQGAQCGTRLGAALRLAGKDADEGTQPLVEAGLLGAQSDASYGVSMAAHDRAMAQLRLEDVVTGVDDDALDRMVLLEQPALTLQLDGARHRVDELAAQHLEEDADVAGVGAEGGGERVEIGLRRW